VCGGQASVAGLAGAMEAVHLRWMLRRVLLEARDIDAAAGAFYHSFGLRRPSRGGPAARDIKARPRTEKPEQAAAGSDVAGDGGLAATWRLGDDEVPARGGGEGAGGGGGGLVHRG
jgi:hypothetical protein